MNRQEQLDLIRAACIEANVKILTRANKWHGIGGEDDIRLADVLLAINESKKRPYGYDVLMEIVAYWNLRKDDLSEQSVECVAFLAGLLK